MCQVDLGDVLTGLEGLIELPAPVFCEGGMEVGPEVRSIPDDVDRLPFLDGFRSGNDGVAVPDGVPTGLLVAVEDPDTERGIGVVKTLRLPCG